MRKLFCVALLALTLAAPAALAQDSGPTATQKSSTTQAAAEKATTPKAKSGTDCTRAGGRCNKPKPRKPWFFGKA